MHITYISETLTSLPLGCRRRAGVWEDSNCMRHPVGDSSVGMHGAHEDPRFTNQAAGDA